MGATVLALIILVAAIALPAPRLPASVWTRTSRRSLRLQTLAAMGIEPRRGWSEARTQLPILALFVSVILPSAISLVLGGAAGVSSSFVLSRDSIGAIWQVEAAIVGLAVALALYGYEALGRDGGIRPEELQRLNLPIAIYVGLGLIGLTGLAFLTSQETGQPALNVVTLRIGAWLSISVIAVGFFWGWLLLRTLPEVAAVASPGFRTDLRLRRITPLSKAAVEARLVELGARTFLASLATESGSRFDPWLSPDEVEESRLYRANSKGAIVDINTVRLREAMQLTPGLTIGLAIGRRVSLGNILAIAPSPLAVASKNLLDGSLRLQRESQSTELETVIQSLRDDASLAAGPRPKDFEAILNVYLECLRVFGQRWHDHVSVMETDHLKESLVLDRSPVGLILDGISSLMTNAIRNEASEAIAQLAAFPSQVAKIGIETGSAAYLSALDAHVRFYWTAIRLSQHSASADARGSWFYLADFVQWTLAMFRRGYSPTPDATLIARAEVAARRALITIGHGMILQNDLVEFRRLGERIAAIENA